MKYLLLVITLFLSSCSRNYLVQENYIQTYQTGDLICTEQKITEALEQQNLSNEQILYLLERGTVSFASGNVDNAIADYKEAVDLLNGLSELAPSEELQKILLDDNYCFFVGEDYEQVLARVYLSLALLHKGDYKNATAILRQAEDIQQRKIELYRKDRFCSFYQLVENPLAKYLLAILSEKGKDFSNAKILYSQVSKLLNQPVEQLKPNDHAKQTLLFVIHNGNIPNKISIISEPSIASGLVLETLLSKDQRTLALSSFTGIPTPLLIQKNSSKSIPLKISVNGCTENPMTFYALGSIAQRQLEKRKPAIAARGLARLALRRGFVAYAESKDPALGKLFDLAMTIANLSSEVDTRSWRTLPNTIEVARFDLNECELQATIESLFTPYPPFKFQVPLKLKSDLTVINVFIIHPGIISIQIPQGLL
ncbi:Tetratricopeptide repeat [Candidatus Rubidus massiliensis]|nr:Tetratricopeptide repeat [Candidatus Rubidus massiliensis]